MDCKFTQKVSELIQLSKKEANKLRSSCIGPEHILLAILDDANNGAFDILKGLGVDTDKIKNEIINLMTLPEASYVPPTQIEFSQKASNIIILSLREARSMMQTRVDIEYIMLAILKENDNNASEILERYNVDYRTFKENFEAGFMHCDDEEGGINREPPQNDNDTKQQKEEKEQTTLEKFSVDLTAAAKEEKLDPVVGRVNEIERVAQILSRRKKNNPILIGEPGVGKSAIVEGLAIRIAEKDVPSNLLHKRVLMLDMSRVVAGTKFRGQFEERIHKIIDDLKNDPNIILFIDEIHTLMGAGSAEGSMDAANILKPALARGELQCIGATTLEEYRKSIEKDGALERRFQKIIVEPSTAEETFQILKNIKENYEIHHNVHYTEAALRACVHLTERYITNRNFPDKAIDVLDEAGSRVHLFKIGLPKEIENQKKTVAEIRTNKNNASRKQNFELAISYRDKEDESMSQLQTMQEDWFKKQEEYPRTVNEKDIENVVSMISGIPVQRIATAENEKLKNMKRVLTSKVIAQDQAVDTLVKAIQRSRIGLKDPNKPIGTFLFLGPTGVGKTHLAKQLAIEMFGSTDALIRIDMSEYMEKFTVSRLIGAPPGYIGYEEGGQLTEKVRRKPYSIVLLDEIEKAHPDVFNMLLQVMDEGRLTDNVGRTIDFKNTIIIMTSNIGTRQLKEFGKGIGFVAEISNEANKEHSRSVISKALNKTFSPEFINRIDEIITFDQLDIDSLTKIVDIELSSFYNRVHEIGYKLIISDDVKRFVASKGYDVQFGARPLKRSIQHHLEDGLAELIINKSPKPGTTIHADLNEDKTAVIFTAAEKAIKK